MSALVTLLVFIPALSVVRAWALQLGWGWFLLPLFPHLPDLGFVDALGLSLVIGLLTFSFTGSAADEKANEGKSGAEKLALAALQSLFYYAMYFVFAVVIHALQGSA